MAPGGLPARLAAWAVALTLKGVSTRQGRRVQAPPGKWDTAEWERFPGDFPGSERTYRRD